MRVQSARYFAYSRSLLIGISLWTLSVSFLIISVLGLVGMVTVDRSFGLWAIGGLLCYCLLRLVRAIQGRGCQCPLCHGPILVSRDCNKHSDARRYPLLGHRRSLLIDAGLRGQFNCMYCGTPYRMWR